MRSLLLTAPDTSSVEQLLKPYRGHQTYLDFQIASLSRVLPCVSVVLSGESADQFLSKVLALREGDFVFDPSETSNSMSQLKAGLASTGQWCYALPASINCPPKECFHLLRNHLHRKDFQIEFDCARPVCPYEGHWAFGFPLLVTDRGRHKVVSGHIQSLGELSVSPVPCFLEEVISHSQDEGISEELRRLGDSRFHLQNI